MRKYIIIIWLSVEINFTLHWKSIQHKYKNLFVLFFFPFLSQKVIEIKQKYYVSDGVQQPVRNILSQFTSANKNTINSQLNLNPSFTASGYQSVSDKRLEQLLRQVRDSNQMRFPVIFNLNIVSNSWMRAPTPPISLFSPQFWQRVENSFGFVSSDIKFN